MSDPQRVAKKLRSSKKITDVPSPRSSGGVHPAVSLEALQLIRAARCQCEPKPADGQTLTKEQFTTALDYTREIFLDQFIENKQLQRDYRRFRNNPEGFNSKEKIYSRRFPRRAPDMGHQALG